MKEQYYNHTTYPVANSQGGSQLMRNELDAIENAFSYLPDLGSANAQKLVWMSADGSKLEAMEGLPNTTMYNVSTSAHGFAPRLPGNTTTFLRGDGTYARPAAAVVADRATNTILGVNDSGNVINFTAAVTQTLTSAATLGNGWYVYLKNSSMVDVTITPNGAETIDGLTPLVLRGGDTRLLISDGVNFRTVSMAGGTGRVLLATLTVPAGAVAINLLTVFTALFDEYEITLGNITGSTITGPLQMQFAIGGAVNFPANSYSYTFSSNVATVFNQTTIALTSNTDLNTVNGVSGTILVQNTNSALWKTVIANTVTQTSASFIGLNIWGAAALAAVSGFRLVPVSGAFAAGGVVHVYGLRKNL